MRLSGWFGRVAEPSGRSRRISGLGYRRWYAGFGRSRDRAAEAPGGSTARDVAAELKRLRREDEILRQERDILKRATAFFAREGSR